MSAFVVGKPHIDAMVALGLYGPRDDHEISPDGAWHTLSWYASDPRVATAGATTADDYFVRLGTLRRSLDHETQDQTGRMLIDACVASVRYRYPDDASSALPGPLDRYWERPYRFPVIRKAAMPTPGQGLALLDCYEYQSCELPEWQGSEAWRYCDSLRSALIARVPGYDGWEWEADLAGDPLAVR